MHEEIQLASKPVIVVRVTTVFLLPTVVTLSLAINLSMSSCLIVSPCSSANLK